MKNGTIFLTFLLLFTKILLGQTEHEHRLQLVKDKSKLWNQSYNSRDSLSFYSLFDSSAVVVSLGGKWIGLEKCKYLCRSLYQKRPDITWQNHPEKTEINNQWPTAYETGTWTESWTEAGDTSRSEINGKYWMMYFFKDNNCYILSAIFTPLVCKGSYCNK